MTHIKEEEVSEIQRYYAGSTVFITGATGCLGRLLVEKLLRSCPDLKRIYVLVRPKRNKSETTRFQNYFDDIIFQRVQEECPQAPQKVFMISGDCGLPDLGMSEKDKEIIISEVNCILHVAATLRFNEEIKIAVYINVRAIRDLLRMAKRMKRLSSFVYVSTAFSFCTQPHEIDEKFYEPRWTAEQLLNIVDGFDEKTLNQMTPFILDKWPNTYSFTKAIAEDVVKKEGASLPVAIVRPSIIAATTSEPIPGWIDTYYGVTGIITGMLLGLIHANNSNPDHVGDIIPADYAINNILAVAWNSSNSINKDVDNNECDSSIIRIYNYVSGPENPLTWRQCKSLTYKYEGHILSIKKMWHHFFFMTSNTFLFTVCHVTLHIIPMYIMNGIAVIRGHKSPLNVLNFLDVIQYFVRRQWTFQNTNTKALWNKLNSEDRKMFPFSMASPDWDSYFSTYIPGIRRYLLKEPPNMRQQRIALARNLKIIHYILMLLIGNGLLYLIIFLFKQKIY